MVDMLRKVLLWGLVGCGVESVKKAYEAGDQAVAEEMEQILRNTLLPLVGASADETSAQEERHEQAVAAVAPIPVSRGETDGEDGLSAFTPLEKRLLVAIKENPEVFSEDLRKWARIDPAKFAGVRNGLVAKGFVTVEQKREGKGHQKVSRLTPTGEERARALLAEQQLESPPAPPAKIVVANGAGDQNRIAPVISAASDAAVPAPVAATPVVTVLRPVMPRVPRVDPQDGSESSGVQLEDDLKVLRAIGKAESGGQRATLNYINHETKLKGPRLGQAKDRLVKQGSIFVDEAALSGNAKGEKVLKLTVMGRSRLKLDSPVQTAVAQT